MFYKNTLSLSKTLQDKIAANDYLAIKDVDNYHKLVCHALQCYHQLGFVLKLDKNKDQHQLDFMKLWGSLGLEVLRDVFGDCKEQVTVKLYNNTFSVSLANTKLDDFYKNMIGAYVFFCIAQAKGNFIQYMTELALTDLSNESIIKVPNPFLDKFLKTNSSVRDTNLILSIIFSLIALVVNPNLASVHRPVGVPVDLVVVEKDLYGKMFCNCSTTSSKNSFSLSMLQIDRSTYESHLSFQNIKAYEGYDVDDWVYYRFYEGTINAGMFESKYAISPSLGVKRGLNIGEYYNLSSFS